MHVIPPRIAVSDVPASAHVPAVTDQVSDPEDCPPEAVNESGEPVTNCAALVTDSPDWGALLTVTEVFEELTAL